MDLWKKLFLLPLGCLLLLFGWFTINFLNSKTPSIQKLTINNFSNEFKLIGNDPDESDHIHHLDLKITGEITSKAVLKLDNPDSTASRVFQISKDSVFVNYSGDWYYNSFILEIESDTLVTGNLNIEYTFVH